MHTRLEGLWKDFIQKYSRIYEVPCFCLVTYVILFAFIHSSAVLLQRFRVEPTTTERPFFKTRASEHRKADVYCPNNCMCRAHVGDLPLQPESVEGPIELNDIC